MTYDADEHRARQVVTSADGARVKVYAAPTLEVEQDEEGRLLHATVFAMGPAGPVALMRTDLKEASAKLRYFHHDHLGSVVSTTGEQGEVLQRLQYDVWGRLRTLSQDPDWAPLLSDEGEGPFADRGFTGHEMLTDVGLIQMNARVYDPAIGRFLSPDNYVQSPTNLQNYNRYSYVLNQPLSLTDPTGHFFFIPAIVAVAVKVAAVAVKAYAFLSHVVGVVVKAWSAFSFVRQVVAGDWQGALRGLVIGQITNGLTNGVGRAFDAMAKGATLGGKLVVELGRAVSHGAVRGAVGALETGKFNKYDALAGVVASGFDSAVGAGQTTLGLDPSKFSWSEATAGGLVTAGVVSAAGGKDPARAFGIAVSINRYNKTGSKGGPTPEEKKVDLALGAASKLDNTGLVGTAVDAYKFAEDPSLETGAGAGLSLLSLLKVGTRVGGIGAYVVQVGAKVSQLPRLKNLARIKFLGGDFYEFNGEERLYLPGSTGSGQTYRQQQNSFYDKMFRVGFE